MKMKNPKDFIPDHNLEPDEDEFNQDEFDDYQQLKEDEAMED